MFTDAIISYPNCLFLAENIPNGIDINIAKSNEINTSSKCSKVRFSIRSIRFDWFDFILD